MFLSDPSKCLLWERFIVKQRVIAWLGPEENDSTFALQFMERLASHAAPNWWEDEVTPPAILETDLPWLYEDGIDSPQRRQESYSLLHLYRRPWFKRLWVRQEIDLGNENSRIMCGKMSIPWKSFCFAFFYISYRGGHYFDIAEFESLSKEIEKSQELISTQALQLKHLTILDLQAYTANTLCADPRDKIYACLGLLNPTEKLIANTPDYSLTTSQVFRSVTKREMQHYSSLDIMICCTIETQHSDLQSWVPNWEISSKYLLIPTGIAPDLKTSYDPIFSNSESLRVFGITSANIEDVFSLEGLLVGVYAENASTDFRRLFEEVEGYMDQMNGDIYETFCRTMCINQFADTFLPFAEGSLHPSSMPNKLQMEGVSKLDTKYLLSVRQAAVGRELFVTDGGFIGLGPVGMMKGDIVCTLVGCHHPTLLRPTKSSKGHPEHQSKNYLVVGPCYVHKLMANEALYGHLQSFRVLRRTAGGGFVFQNSSTGDMQDEDPRLATPKLATLQEQMRKEGYPNDAKRFRREVRLRTLQAAGFEFETFDLV